MSGAYWFGFVMTFLFASPFLLAQIGFQHEELPVRILVAAVTSLLWPFLLAGSLIRWRLRARRPRVYAARGPGRR